MIKSFFALGLLFAAGGQAQLGTQAGALGGRFVSQGLSRPLGGFAPADPPPSSLNFSYGYGYSYPVYIPAAPAPPAAPAQPVIINQYFTTAAPVPPVREPVAAKAAEAVAAITPSAPSVPPVPNYYLVAYKNHAVYSVLAWWIEDTTLHYVTMQNTHNQASTSLIDFDLMKKLNRP